MNSIVTKKIFFCFFIIIAVIFGFEIFNKGIQNYIFYNLLENVYFSVLIIIPIFFFKKNIYKVIYLIPLYFFFCLSIYIETIYYCLFNTYFSSSTIFVVLDSNTNEANEFLRSYLTNEIISFSAVYLILVFIFLFKLRRYILSIEENKKRYKVKLAFFLGLGITVYKASKLVVYNLPYLVVTAQIEYSEEAQKLGEYKSNKLGGFTNVLRETNAEEKELYVLILGESTTRSHLGVYDYYRQTTPLLDSLKSDLLIYKNVISPHAYSVGAITKILTLGNYEFPEKIKDGSILQLANKAKFQTSWISNQRPIGTYESLITKIALSSLKYKFLSTTIAGNSQDLDEDLLPEFHKVLIDSSSNKKFVVIHLMGTHHHYENRYPKKFNKFIEEPITNFKSEESFEKINHYDNAILYNDYLLSRVIKKVNELNVKGFVLFLSDHGEEMFNDINMAGHNEDIYSKEMFDIPFILWQSEKYKEDNYINFVSHRKYMTDDLFHSMADLLNISAEEVDTTRSIFHRSFKERKRIIKDSLDYDSFFNLIKNK